MAKNKIQDLRDHLFVTLERLNDDELVKDSDALQNEINRAKAISGVSHQIIESAKVEINYMEALANVGNAIGKPNFLGLEEGKK